MDAIVAELLGISDQRTEPGPRILPEAQVASLLELGANMTFGLTLRRFDLITPRASAPIPHAGEPHIVLEVLETPRVSPPMINGVCDIGSRRHDVFLAVVNESDGGIVTLWAESYWFEPYVLQSKGTS